MSGREKLQGIAHMWSLAYTSIHSESKCVHVGSTTCSREDKKEHIRCVWGGGDEERTGHTSSEGEYKSDYFSSFNCCRNLGLLCFCLFWF